MGAEPTCSACQKIKSFLGLSLGAGLSRVHACEVQVGKSYVVELHFDTGASLGISGPVKNVVLDPADNFVGAKFVATSSGTANIKVSGGDQAVEYSVFFMFPPT